MKTGFGGVETIVPAPGKKEYSYWCYSTFLTQAVNDRIEQLYEPLTCAPVTSVISTSDSLGKLESLIIVGGATEKTSHLVSALQRSLAPSFQRIVHALTMDSVNYQDSSLAAVLCLADMDWPCFQELTDNKLSSLKRYALTLFGVILPLWRFGGLSHYERMRFN